MLKNKRRQNKKLTKWISNKEPKREFKYNQKKKMTRRKKVKKIKKEERGGNVRKRGTVRRQ